MTGGARTMIRLYEMAMADTPIADRWDAPEIITNRCIAVDSDLIRTMTEAEWRAFVAGKYPDFDGDADDFTSGPPHPALAPENEQ